MMPVLVCTATIVSKMGLKVLFLYYKDLAYYQNSAYSGALLYSTSTVVLIKIVCAAATQPLVAKPSW